MMKKLLLILLSSCALVSATDRGIVSKELFYDTGMSLACQSEVTDWPHLKQVLSKTYNEVSEIKELVDTLIQLDDNFDVNGTVSPEQWIDMLDLEMSEDPEYLSFQEDVIVLVVAYQQLFTIFMQVCQDQPTFELFTNHIDNCFDRIDTANDELLNALYNFSAAFENFIDKVDQIF